MFSRMGQCKWTCRLTPFRIAFILLHLLVISVIFSFFSFIWAKTYFPCIAQLSYFSVLGCKIYAHERRETVCHRGVFATPGNMPCLVCFVNQLFINLGIPSHHCLFSTNCATMLMPSDVIYSWHHHALSNKNILKSWLLSTVQISWFVYHLVSLTKFTHTTEANILLG